MLIGLKGKALEDVANFATHKFQPISTICAKKKTKAKDRMQADAGPGASGVVGAVSRHLKCLQQTLEYANLNKIIKNRKFEFPKSATRPGRKVA